METKWNYYNTKRGGNRYRGKSRGRGRGNRFAAVSLPRNDVFQNGPPNLNQFFENEDKAMDGGEIRDETVLSLSYGQNMLGAAFYEQSSQLLKIMNDISEDNEFEYLKRLIDEVNPTTILINRSQDLAFTKFLSAKYDKDVAEREGEVPSWDASLAYSTTVSEEDDTTKIVENEEEEEVVSTRLCKLASTFFQMPRALERLKKLVGYGNAEMTEEDKYLSVTMRFDIEAVNMMRSLGALLLFLDDTRLGVETEPLTVPPRIKSIKTWTLQNLVDIDFNTIQALDILPKESEATKAARQSKSLFSLVDKCRSIIGRKCLQKWFRNPITDRKELETRLKCVNFFHLDWNTEVTAKVSAHLRKVKQLKPIFTRFQNGTAALIHWESFVTTISALVEIATIIKNTRVSSELLVDEEILREVSEVVIITTSIINFTTSKVQGRVTIMPGINAELDALRDTYENLPLTLTAVAREEAVRLGLGHFSKAKFVYVPLVGFMLSLPSDFPVHQFPDMSLVYSTSEEMRVKNSTTERLEEENGDILIKLIDNQTEILLKLKTQLMKKRRSINELLSLAARVDALVSLGIVAAENGWNCPSLVDEPLIEAVELYHPISAMIVKKNFVPNGVSSGRDGQKVSVITGPNACGKSVYMKSVGILVFLAHIGSFVPAQHARVGMVDRIVTRMFTVDSVLDGLSTFAKDVEQVALALRRATVSSLVIIDEFGKGTMTEVGLSLLAACMNHWMAKGDKGCPHVFLSSHFHALPRYIPTETKLITFLTFTIHRESGQIKYLFKLTPGRVDCSFAMAVAKEEGIPMDEIGRACRVYQALKSGSLLREIQANVNNEEEGATVRNMEVIIENEEELTNFLESKVLEKKNRPAKKSAKKQVEQPEKPVEKAKSVSEEVSSPSFLGIRHPESSRSSRLSRASSLKSAASFPNQLAVFDALLPKPKKKVVKPVENKSPVRERSPDLFLEEEEQLTPRKLIPMMQRLSSEEEERESSQSQSVSKKLQGTKRARSPSIHSQPSTPKQISRSSAHETATEPVFKTPMNQTRQIGSSQSKSQIIRKPSRLDETQEFVFKTPQLTQKSTASSARRGKNDTQFSFLNTSDSIFEPETSQRPPSRRNESAISYWHPISPETSSTQFSMFETPKSERKNKSPILELSPAEKFLFGVPDSYSGKSQDVFVTPQSKSKSKSSQRISSRSSVSPSSVILGELSRIQEDPTPLPRGDRFQAGDFSFDAAGHNSDVDDEEFLKSFL